MLSFLLNILSTITGQLGPNYDPLFYDVMIYGYIAGGVIFAIIIIVVIVVVLRRQNKMQVPKNTAKFCQKCGNGITKHDKFCTKCGNESKT